MQWSDVTSRPTLKVLRQFAGLCLVFFLGLAAWRAWHGQLGRGTQVLAALGLGIGVLGLWRPAAVRWVYSGWMIAAFPIGWAVSRIIVGMMFYLVFTPVALLFRLIGRDSLALRRRDVPSYWTTKAEPEAVDEYLRQS